MSAGTLMAEVAALIGDPARANMLAAMLDGRAHAAGELAANAGIAAPTASGHLAKLREGGLVEVAVQGRHRYYRLASADVARTLEGIMALSAEPLQSRVRATPRVPPALREARTCYDHLAGRLGVAIADALVDDQSIALDDGVAAVTDKGRARLGRLGIDLDRCSGGRRPLCRPCLDWSERRPHLAGLIGSALLERLLAQHWIRRTAGSRVISITPLGRHELERTFGFQH